MHLLRQASGTLNVIIEPWGEMCIVSNSSSKNDDGRPGPDERRDSRKWTWSKGGHVLHYKRWRLTQLYQRVLDGSTIFTVD